MNHNLIIALDDISEEEAKRIISQVSQECNEYIDKVIFKVNDLLTLKGLEGIKKMIEGTGARLMLDPKWHDIPKTVANNFQKLFDSGLGDDTDYVTLHASNGDDGIRAGVQKRDELGMKTKILAVTALTSLEETGVQAVFDETAKHAVLKLAKIALHAGADGIVCSPLEVDVLRKVYGDNFIIVNPGVRFDDGESHDQKRVLTPKRTIENGSTDIVMGRPILEAKDIPKVIKRFFDEITEVKYKEKTGEYEFEKLLYTGSWKELLSFIGAFYFRPEGGKYCRLTSGLISDTYINIGSIETNYLVVERATSELASQIQEQGIEADIVMGAEMGSVRLSLYLAEKLGIEDSVYTEKDQYDIEKPVVIKGVAHFRRFEKSEVKMELKRHARDLEGKRIILSEDLVTQGSTLDKMKEQIAERGGTVVAVASVAQRFTGDTHRGTPFFSCYKPEAFGMYWDYKTPENLREGKSRLPEGSQIAEKAKNEWGELVQSMRR